MTGAVPRFVRTALPPPRLLRPLSAGIDISSSGVKVAIAEETMQGYVLRVADERRFSPGVFVGGEMTDRKAVVDALRSLARAHNVREAHVALPEIRSYLFETAAAGATRSAMRMDVERRIDELIPLPPAEVIFDIVRFEAPGKPLQAVGVGYARRAVNELIEVFEESGINIRSIESEIFSIPRVLFPSNDPQTLLIIDIGRTETKVIVETGRIPRYAATLDIGGHAFTLAVQKYFGVTEDAARQVKIEQGIVGGQGNEEYTAAMLSTASAMRDEILKRLDYWQTHAQPSDRVTAMRLTGGNAIVRGIAEYFEAAFNMPVHDGNVFANFAPTEQWLPPVSRWQSLAYATAIGLTLRDHLQ